MGGHPAETPSSGASSSRGAADERDTTSAVGDGDMDMGCGGEYEAPVAVGFQPPLQKRGLTHNFGALFREAMAKAASSPLLVRVDFNAPHTQWGYGADSPKGKRLAEEMDELGLVLLNEPAPHTRIGTGRVPRHVL
ncbi:hypothetical protein MRX96_046715 [Rhipicephalus microplus]